MAAILVTATIIEVEDVDGEVVEAVDMVEAMDMEVVAGEEVVEEEVVGEAMQYVNLLRLHKDVSELIARIFILQARIIQGQTREQPQITLKLLKVGLGLGQMNTVNHRRNGSNPCSNLYPISLDLMQVALNQTSLASLATNVIGVQLVHLIIPVPTRQIPSL